MANYEFGNYLYKLRKENNLTQSAVAYQLDISDKTVSKWELGKSTPSIQTLELLSALYGVTFEELIENYKNKKNVNITKIVLTGGPCGGKTTALTKIDNYFSKRGYRVLYVPESATDLKCRSGLTPKNCASPYEFQRSIFKTQKFKEELIEEQAGKMNDVDKILIVCDRGIIDSKAYVKNVEFKRLLKEFKTNEVKERDSYDAVFQMVTAAKGKEEYYTLENNAARDEPPEDARRLDDRMIECWTGHPHFRIIDNSTDFEKKIERLLKEVAVFLGEPEPFEIERKYLIEYPNIKKLEQLPNCTKVEITQNYLKSDGNSERRVRARGIDGNYMYYQTEKKSISNLKRVEVEKRLTSEEYIKLLMESDDKLKTIHKTRYCLSENNQYFEIDVYPEWNNQAIMEIELSSENQEIKIPSFIKMVKEVTDDEQYKNYEMAKKMPKEIVKKKTLSKK